MNDSLIYDRSKDEIKTLNLKHLAPYLNEGVEIKEEEKIRIRMSKNIDYGSLLLTTDFNSFCSKKIVSAIVEWFSDKFIVINSAEKARYAIGKIKSGGATISDDISEIARTAGLIGDEFAYVKDDKSDTTKIISVLDRDEHQLRGINADQIESLGTMRLISIMPAIVTALVRGATLAVDELDASLHPMIVMNLISIFHNDEVNKNKAQIIFNTHNPIYLSKNLLRRDEIKFVEKNKDTKSSELYSLADFKANGEASVRGTSDYMKNYFVNRYGAIEDIDFTDILVSIMDRMNADVK